MLIHQLKESYVEAILEELEKLDNKEADANNEVSDQLDSLFNSMPELQKAEEELFGESAGVLSEGAFTDKLKKFATLVAFCLLPMISSGNAEAALVHAEDTKDMMERVYLSDGDSLFDRIAALEKDVGEYQSLKYLSASDDYFEKEARSFISIDKTTNTVVVMVRWKANESDWRSLQFENQFKDMKHFKLQGNGDLEYSRVFKMDNQQDVQVLTKFMKFNRTSLSNNKSTLKKANLLKKRINSKKK